MARKPSSNIVSEPGEVVPSHDFRQEFGHYVDQVDVTRVPVNTGSNPKRPHYQLRAASMVSKHVLDLVVPIGLDKARKNMVQIKGMALYNDLKFGILVGGKIKAVFERHPDYMPEIVKQSRAVAAEREQVAAAPTINERLGNIESLLRDGSSAKRRSRRRDS